MPLQDLLISGDTEDIDDDLQLNCSLSPNNASKTDLNFQWINNARTVLSNTSELQIPYSSVMNNTQYTCVALVPQDKSIFGMKSTTVTLSGT